MTSHNVRKRQFWTSKVAETASGTSVALNTQLNQYFDWCIDLNQPGTWNRSFWTAVDFKRDSDENKKELHEANTQLQTLLNHLNYQKRISDREYYQLDEVVTHIHSVLEHYLKNGTEQLDDFREEASAHAWKEPEIRDRDEQEIDDTHAMLGRQVHHLTIYTSLFEQIRDNVRSNYRPSNLKGFLYHQSHDSGSNQQL